jgi:hypothetical protein
MGTVSAGEPVCGAMHGELLPSGLNKSPINLAGLLHVGYTTTSNASLSMDSTSLCLPAIPSVQVDACICWMPKAPCYSAIQEDASKLKSGKAAYIFYLT